MLIWKNRILCEADKGTQGTDNTQKQTEDATGTNGGEVKPFAVFTTEAEFQTKIDSLLKDRLARADEKAKTAAAKAAADAERQALSNNAQFKELSEKQAAHIAKIEADLLAAQQQVEALTGNAGKYRSALEANVAERRKGLPDHILGLLDALDPVAQLNWLTTNAAKLGAGQNGVPGTPRAQGQGGDMVAVFLAEQEEKAKAVKNPLLRN